MKSFNKIVWISSFAFVVGCAGPNNQFAHQQTDQRLSDEQFDQVQLTWSGAQVHALLGEPWRKVAFDRSATVAWDYRYIDTWGYRAEYSIIFDASGVVVGRVQTRLERDRFGLEQ
jgi:hypothetical protein